MKKLFLMVCVFFTQTIFAQTVTITDWNNDDILEYVKHSSDGTKLEEGEFLNGKYHGTWYSYYDNGTISAIANFKNGKRNGKWRFFNYDGILLTEVVYKDNRKISANQYRYFE